MCGIRTTLPTTVTNTGSVKTSNPVVTNNNNSNVGNNNQNNGATNTTINTNDQNNTQTVGSKEMVGQASFPTKTSTTDDINKIKSEIASQASIHGINASELGALIRTMKNPPNSMSEEDIKAELQNLLDTMKNSSPADIKSQMSQAITTLAQSVNHKFHPDLKSPFANDATLTYDEAKAKQGEERAKTEAGLKVDGKGMVSVASEVANLSHFKFGFNVNVGKGGKGEAQTSNTSGTEKPAGFVDIFNALNAGAGLNISFEKFKASVDLKVNKELFMKLLDAPDLKTACDQLKAIIDLLPKSVLEKIQLSKGESQ